MRRERITEVVAARRAREDEAREAYLPAFLAGMAAYGRAELLMAAGASEDAVVIAELEVEETLRRSRGQIEHSDVDPGLVQAGWGWLDGYGAAREAYERRIAEAAWARHVD